MGKRKTRKNKELNEFSSFSMEGDIIKIELIDSSYNIYYRGKANINNDNQMRKLMMQLEIYGVKFPKPILKQVSEFLNLKGLEEWI